MFVDWCFVQAFGKTQGRERIYQPTKSMGAGCLYSRQYYQKHKRLYFNPNKGDQIFFYNSSKTDISHTGLVYKVDNTYVYTIEGNTSPTEGVEANGGQVAKKKYVLCHERIAGYGRPNYTHLNENTKIDTDSFNKKLKVKVIGKLSVKRNANEDSTEIHSYKNDSIIEIKPLIYNEYWVKVSFKDNKGKDDTGYVNIKQLRIYKEHFENVGKVSQSNEKQSKLKVNIGSGLLNCRAEPSSNSNIKGKFNNNTYLINLGKTKKNNKTWYKVKGVCTKGTTITGYCLGDYLKSV